MWWEIIYLPTSLFSLKASEATNVAGKSLLLPSPYSVKMALLNAICTYDSVKLAEEKFDLIKNLQLEFALSEYIVVNNCFIRVIQESRNEIRVENPNLMFKSTVAFREYLFFSDTIKISFNSNMLSEQDILFLKKCFTKVNYFGKRGCFFQLTSFSETPRQNLSNDYSREITNKDFFHDGRAKVIVRVDDFGTKTTFNKVNNFSSEKTERISKLIALPYRSIKSNKNFTLFKRS